jgi:hypothetical protein
VSLEACRDLLEMKMKAVPKTKKMNMKALLFFFWVQRKLCFIRNEYVKALFVRPIEICFILLIKKILQLISLSTPFFDLLRTFMVCLDDHEKNGEKESKGKEY